MVLVAVPRFQNLCEVPTLWSWKDRVCRWCSYDIIDANSKDVQGYLIVLWPLVLVFCCIAVYWYSDWLFIGKERSKPRLGVCEVLLLLCFSCNFAVSWKLFHILLKSERERERPFEMLKSCGATNGIFPSLSDLFRSYCCLCRHDLGQTSHQDEQERNLVLSSLREASGPRSKWRCTTPMFCRAEFFTTQTWSPYEKIKVTDFVALRWCAFCVIHFSEKPLPVAAFQKLVVPRWMKLAQRVRARKSWGWRENIRNMDWYMTKCSDIEGKPNR